MRIAVYRRFGPPDVLEIAERPAPEPKRGEVCVRVHAAALNPKDVLLRKGKLAFFQGWRFPKSTAHDFAGVIDTLGPGVSSVEVGDAVFGMQNGFDPRSAAERVCVPATELARKPERLGFPEAASLPLAGLTALQALRDDGDVQPGQHVVVRGASGGVGTLAVQIARVLGARVTGICSAKNRSLVEGLGAHAVLAYDELDPLRELDPVDVFFDVHGNLGFAEVRPRLTARGIYVGTLPRLAMARDVARAALTKRHARLVIVRSNRADLELLRSWVDDGSLSPVLDSTFALDEVAEAHRRVETRRCRGKVVLEVSEPAEPSSRA